MNCNNFDDNKELIKLSPILLYEIATDIQVTDKWRPFATLVGFTYEQMAMLQINSGDRFPAENVMYHWFSKNPRAHHLAEILCTLQLEKSLIRLKGNLDSATFDKLMEKIQKNKNNYARQLSQEDSDGCLESINDDTKETKLSNQPMMRPQLSNTSNNSTVDCTTPEPGVINISFHDPAVPRSSLMENIQNESDIPSENSSNEDCTYTLIKNLLKGRSTEFYSNEFVEMEECNQALQGKFSSHFQIKIRANQFHVRAFFLPKILQSTKDKKKLYNIVWCLENFRLHQLPILTGFCFYNDYLFLLFPFKRWYSLYDTLHRPHDAENKTISAFERLNIVKEVGEALAFLHNSLPFGGYHGQIKSYNVMISNADVILTGFDKFCTQKPEYLKGLEVIKKHNIDSEECFRRDKIQYLELICETWWNIHPSTITGNHIESSLIKDITGRVIVDPKIKYDHWNFDFNEEVRALVKRFSEDSKGSRSVAEMVEELCDCVHEPFQSLEPPSYDECTESFSELKIGPIGDPYQRQDCESISD